MTLVTKAYTLATNEDWRASITFDPAGTLAADTVLLMQVKPSPRHPDALWDLTTAAPAAGEIPDGTLTLSYASKTASWVVLRDDVAEAVPGDYTFDIVAIYASGRIERLADCNLTVARGGTAVPRDPPSYVIDIGGAVVLEP